MAGEILGVIFIVFLWLVAPALIAKSKGRRWWVWMLVSIPIPMLGLMITIFMAPYHKENSSIS
jgi:hypothetical protein